jgi:hypothetical protein
MKQTFYELTCKGQNHYRRPEGKTIQRENPKGTFKQKSWNWRCTTCSK